MTDKLNNTDNEQEERLKKWAGEFLSEERDAASLSFLIVFLQIKSWHISDSANSHIELIIDYIPKNISSTGKEREIKEGLRKIEKIWNSYEATEAEKNQAVEDFEDMLFEILAMVK